MAKFWRCIGATLSTAYVNCRYTSSLLAIISLFMQISENIWEKYWEKLLRFYNRLLG